LTPNLQDLELHSIWAMPISTVDFLDIFFLVLDIGTWQTNKISKCTDRGYCTEGKESYDKRLQSLPCLGGITTVRVNWPLAFG